MKLLKDYRVLVFLLIPYFKPLCVTSLWEGGMVDNFLNTYRILSCVIILFIWLSSYRRIGRLPLLYGVYGVFTLIALNHVNPAGISDTVIREMSIFSLILLIEMVYCVSENAVVRALFSIVFAYTWIQFLLLLVFPSGFNHGINETRVHFLGLDNEFTLFSVLAFVVSQIYIQLYPRKKRVANTVIFLVFAMSLYMASGTGVAVTIVLVAFYLIRGLSWKIVNGMNAFIAGIVLNLVLVVFNSTDLFAWFIVNVLHKTTTFTSRTYIWKSAIMTIASNPLWGTGNSSVHVKDWTVLSYAHNMFLDVGMRYGAIAIALFCLVIATVCVRSKRFEESGQNTLFFISILALMLSGLAEGAEYRVEFFTVLTILYYHDAPLPKSAAHIMRRNIQVYE